MSELEQSLEKARQMAQLVAERANLLDELRKLDAKIDAASSGPTVQDTQAGREWGKTQIPVGEQNMDTTDVKEV